MTSIYGREWSREDILRRVGRMDQVAGIKLVEAADGKERGSRILEVRTGSGVSFHVQADRALDISACTYRGIPLAWMSSAGQAHPSYYEPQGLGLLRSFQGGLLVTCGLDQFGAPCTDRGEALGLHGRVSNLPATSVGYSNRWVGEAYELEIQGEIRQARLFGENLVLRRSISTRLGSTSIRIEDSVTNEAFQPHPHMILYHFNLGFPLVSEDSRLHLEAEETVPRDEDAQAGLAEWRNLEPPTSAYKEQVFRHKMATDDEGRARVEIENPLLGVGLRLTYNTTNLPYLYQWKMMGEGMYVLGIEPANCGVIAGRAAARRLGELPHLRPGESRTYVLEAEAVEYH